MTLTLTPTDIAHGGYCVARHDGMVVFVTGALPGEVVDVEITGRRAKMWYGRTVGVRSASPDRVPHVWPLAEREGIGGVDLGHVSLEASRRWKAHVVSAQMQRIAHVDVPVEVEAAPGDDERHGLSWRTRVTVQVRDHRLGMYEAKSHRVVDIDQMPLAHEEIQQAVARDISTGAPGADGTRSYVRSSGSGLLVDAPESATVTEVVHARAGSWTFEVAADGFWQVHRHAPEVLVDAVLDAVGEIHGRVVDLYAGAGLFTVPLACVARDQVTAVEGSSRAVSFLRRNTRDLSVRCLDGDVARVLPTLDIPDVDVVVCDPPRAGAGAKAVAEISRLAPARVVYVACDPAALARDVSLFAQAGYDLEGLRAFDLFPLTHHVECVALLTRRGSRS
ncbi:MAG: RsmD family RNA methyltransferase [Propionibacteriaceae bacterium]|nr:RsmD family RNA methyltransferase [Propionibacteriaceae bacterium]